jgi:hypothetical protein
MEFEIYARCRQAFIRRLLRSKKQQRLEFDSELRMQAQCRVGQLRAVQFPDDFTWTIWREGNRGYLVLVTEQTFPTMGQAIAHLRNQLPYAVTVD